MIKKVFLSLECKIFKGSMAPGKLSQEWQRPHACTHTCALS